MLERIEILVFMVTESARRMWCRVVDHNTVSAVGATLCRRCGDFRLERNPDA